MDNLILYQNRGKGLQNADAKDRQLFLEALEQPQIAEALAPRLGFPPGRGWNLVGVEPWMLPESDLGQTSSLVSRAAAQAFLDDTSGMGAWSAGRFCAVLFGEETDRAALAERCDRLCLALAEELACPVRGVLSGQYETPGLLPAAWQDVMQGLAYARFLETSSGVLSLAPAAQQVGACQNSETFFMDMASRMNGAFAAGDEALLEQLVTACEAQILGGLPRVSAVHMGAIHFVKPLEVTLIGSNVVDRGFIARYQLARRLLETQTAAEFRQVFRTSMADFMAYATHRSQNRYAARMEEVMDYLLAHIQEPELSLTSLAARFDMTEAALSTQFKEHYSDSIPNVIHRARITRIREGLVQTTKSAKQLAQENGYISVATMNRAFVKLEGVYPGQYRKQSQNR